MRPPPRKSPQKLEMGKGSELQKIGKPRFRGTCFLNRPPKQIMLAPIRVIFCVVFGVSMAMDSPWPWTVHGHGLSMAMDSPWPLRGICHMVPSKKKEREKIALEARKLTIASEVSE